MEGAIAMAQKETCLQERGLEKKLSPLNVWALAFGCIIGWGAYVMPGNTFLINAGPIGTIIAMMVAMLIMIIIAMNYQYMINTYPMSGGEFIYTQRVFGKLHGFICAWFLGLSYLTIVPLNATALALIGRNLLHSCFQWGVHYTIAGYDVFFGEVILAITALVLLAYLSIRGVKLAGWFQTGLTIVLIGGVLIIMIAALINPEVTISNLTPAFYPGKKTFAGILAVVAVAPWAFVGFDTVPQAAEEFQFSPRKSKMILVLSIIFGGSIYIILNTITAAVIPEEYQSWVDYISKSSNLEGIMALPTFFAANKLLGKIGLFILGLSVLAAILSGIMGFYMATSRLLYAMAEEKVIPSIFSKLHIVYKTPYYAIIFVLFVSMISPFLGRTALGWIVDMSSLGAAIGYGYTSAVAFICAKRDKKISIMVTGILGVIFSVVFAILLLIPIPGLSCSLGRESYIALAIWIIIGIVFYFTSYREKNRKREYE